jgi:hypothetical protein
MEIISRDDAKAAGLTHYFTGQPCKHGHVAVRYVCDHACFDCATVKHANRNARKRQRTANSKERRKQELKAHKIISREQALAEGLLTYFTGLPCQNGHISPRYAKNINCIECKDTESERSLLRKQIKESVGEFVNGMKVISKQEAIDLGLKRFFTGIPCNNGHICERVVYCGGCHQCRIKKSKAYEKRHPEKKSEWGKNYYKRKVDTFAQKSKERRAEDPKKEKDRIAKWHDANPGKVAEYSAKRKASEIRATPKWLSESDNKFIAEHYEMAKWLQKISGVEWQVDHVIPLRGKKVCGLHVPWNMQLLPRSLNVQKSNKLLEV